MFSPIAQGKAEGRVWGAFAALSAGCAMLSHATAAQVDTPAQVQAALQAACSRSAASDRSRDLTGAMAMYAPNFVTTSVTGRKANFQQVQAGAAYAFARINNHSVGHCTVSQVTTRGDQAQAVLHWHYTTTLSRSASAPAYTYVCDYQEQTTWKKLPGGWRETSAQATGHAVYTRSTRATPSMRPPLPH